MSEIFRGPEDGCAYFARIDDGSEIVATPDRTECLYRGCSYLVAIATTSNGSKPFIQRITTDPCDKVSKNRSRQTCPALEAADVPHTLATKELLNNALDPGAAFGEISGQG